MRRQRLAAFAAIGWLALTACGGGSDAKPSSGGSKVSVLYAGSLESLMEQKIGPAFQRATGDGYAGFGAGSQEVAADIQARSQTGDVFISASPKVDASLQGSGAGDWVSWYATFATAPLVIAYNPHSRFASDFRDKPWFDVLTSPGIKLGRTDPKLDPKGVLTAAALVEAQQDYHLTGFAKRVGATAAVFPEEDLVSRLEAGQLDAGFFYTNEAAPAHLPTVSLGRVKEQATFTVTVLNRAPHPAAAAAFVRYLLTTAKPTLSEGGLHLMSPTLTGPATAVPANLRTLVGS